MEASVVQNLLTSPENTVIFRPPKNQLFNDRISDTNWFRKSAAISSGQVQPISWPDVNQMPVRTLLKILSDSEKSATITVHSPPCLGQISLRNGNFCFACVTPSSAPISPHKAFHRILFWKTGTLRLEWNEPPRQKDEVCEKVVPLLQENAARQEELCSFENVFPPQTQLKIRALPETVQDFGPAELDILQMAMEGKTIQDILDAHPFSDLEIYRTLLSLSKAKIIGNADESELEWSRAS